MQAVRIAEELFFVQTELLEQCIELSEQAVVETELQFVGVQGRKIPPADQSGQQTLTALRRFPDNFAPDGSGIGLP